MNELKKISKMKMIFFRDIAMKLKHTERNLKSNEVLIIGIRMLSYHLENTNEKFPNQLLCIVLRGSKTDN